jgi:hypothetical protein
MLRCLRLIGLAMLALALAGCATGYLLDNQVQSFSQLQAVPAQPTYRFERALSQQGDPNQQALEAMADPALQRAGLRRDDAAPRYSVQVLARVDRILSPYGDPYWGGWGGGWSLGFGGRHGAIGFGAPFPTYESYWFRRQVSVIVRELASNRIVYETHASNEGPLLDSPSVLAAMFDAAMQGFPTPPPGRRRVDINLGGRA